jgi:predicted anti-sigma-YlaC factor YlaD
MSGKHWTDDELLEHMYGLRRGDEHLESCSECAARARMVADTRAAITEPPDVPHDLLEAQRRSIYHRLGTPVRGWHPLRWAVPAAAIATLALGLTLFHGNDPLHPRGDDQFYAELSSLDQNPAPRAVQPIEALVEDDVQE